MVDGANQTFYSAAKNAKFQFSRRAKWPWRDKILGAPQRGQNIIVNQSKPVLVIVSINFSREIEWAVFTETASYGSRIEPYQQRLKKMPKTRQGKTRTGHHKRKASS